MPRFPLRPERIVAKHGKPRRRALVVRTTVEKRNGTVLLLPDAYGVS